MSMRRVHGRAGCCWIKLFLLKARPLPAVSYGLCLVYAPGPVLKPRSAFPAPAEDGAGGLALTVGYSTLPFQDGCNRTRSVPSWCPRGPTGRPRGAVPSGPVPSRRGAPSGPGLSEPGSLRVPCPQSRVPSERSARARCPVPRCPHSPRGASFRAAAPPRRAAMERGAAGPLPLSRLAGPLLRRLSELLDRAAPGKGWRELAQRAGSRGTVRLSPLDLEQCSLQVLEPEGSPSWSLLKLLGDRGCTVVELAESLQALEHTEALRCLSLSGVKIVVQPDSQAVLSGQVVKLCCWATGHPFVQYQWFKQEREVPHGNSPELVLSPVSVKDSGFYICRVNSESSFMFSRWARLEVCELQDPPHGLLTGLPENKLCICNQPQPQNLTVGDALVLQCGAVGNPIPHYQWFRNGFPLANGSKNVYTVTYVDVGHQGTYWCHVFNDREDEDSKKVEVIIEDLSDLQELDPEEESSHRPVATDKVALLIGNMSYLNHPQLKAPMVDVYELTSLLRQLDFKVVSLLDLTESEMRNAVDEFLLLLDEGVYGLLYYAGHGYENYGNSFMVPVDAPNPYRSANCLCVQNILRLMQEKQTGLNVFLLDMCRKRNEYDDTILILDALKVTANIVFGYATCQGAEAYEIQQLGLANGIFMKFLKNRLLEDKKVTVLLDEVAEDMGKCPLTKGKQALEIRSSLSEKRALTDPVQRSTSSAESLARNLQWAKAHELPESMSLEFQCGVQIQLGFAAEFSNVMIIYTQIVKKPPEITACRAHITDFPLDLDVDPKEANKGTPEETGSYLVSKDLPKHCLYTRLSSLQKLREDHPGQLGIRNHSQAELLLPPSSVRTAFPEVNRGKVLEKSLLGSSFFYYVLIPFSREGSGKAKCTHSCCWSPVPVCPFLQRGSISCVTQHHPQLPSPQLSRWQPRGTSRKPAKLCDVGWISQAL